jgi:hypothetical protein
MNACGAPSHESNLSAAQQLDFCARYLLQL